jgi:glucose/arabinose dehydrogenase
MYGKIGRTLACAAATALLTAGSFTVAQAQTPSIPPGDLTINLQSVCSGLTSPVLGTHAGDHSGRLFVVDQTGKIFVFDTERGVCLAQPYLDLSAKVVTLNAGYDERGLLGLAFHPDFRSNGRLFVRYSSPRTGAAGEPCAAPPFGCHAEVLAEYRVRDPRANVAEVIGERVLLRVDKPQFNHNAGDVVFGRDGYLYFGLGDGGGANDGLSDVPPTHGPIGNAQNLDSLLGKMLRIDVNHKDAGKEYAIPRRNPFAGSTPGADEIYAYGFRNPFRFSFDEGWGGDRRLILGEVGQNKFEEIDVVVKGGNYGWVVNEGFHCFDPKGPNTPPATCPGAGARGEPLLKPVAEYNHGDGIAIVGGYVYRGTRSPALWGKYIFGDFSRAFAPGNGRLLFADADGAMADLFEFRLGDANAPLGKYLKGLGRDERGEIYVLTSTRLGPTGSTGEVHRLIGPPPTDADNDRHEHRDDRD